MKTIAQPNKNKRLLLMILMLCILIWLAITVVIVFVRKGKGKIQQPHKRGLGDAPSLTDTLKNKETPLYSKEEPKLSPVPGKKEQRFDKLPNMGTYSPIDTMISPTGISKPFSPANVQATDHYSAFLDFSVDEEKEQKISRVREMEDSTFDENFLAKQKGLERNINTLSQELESLPLYSGRWEKIAKEFQVMISEEDLEVLTTADPVKSISRLGYLEYKAFSDRVLNFREVLSIYLKTLVFEMKGDASVEQTLLNKVDEFTAEAQKFIDDLVFKVSKGLNLRCRVYVTDTASFLTLAPEEMEVKILAEDPKNTQKIEIYQSILTVVKQSMNIEDLNDEETLREVSYEQMDSMEKILRDNLLKTLYLGSMVAQNIFQRLENLSKLFADLLKKKEKLTGKPIEKDHEKFLDAGVDHMASLKEFENTKDVFTIITSYFELYKNSKQYFNEFMTVVNWFYDDRVFIAGKISHLNEERAKYDGLLAETSKTKVEKSQALMTAKNKLIERTNFLDNLWRCLPERFRSVVHEISDLRETLVLLCEVSMTYTELNDLSKKSRKVYNEVLVSKTVQELNSELKEFYSLMQQIAKKTLPIKNIMELVDEQVNSLLHLMNDYFTNTGNTGARILVPVLPIRQSSLNMITEIADKALIVDTEEITKEFIVSIREWKVSIQTTDMLEKLNDIREPKKIMYREISKFIKSDVLASDEEMGDYKALKMLGFGSFADVFKAKHKITGEIVALKRMDKNTTGHTVVDVIKETAIPALLKHPGFCKSLDFFYDDEYNYIVFEFINGTELDEIICKEGKLTEEKARDYIRQLISILDYMNNNGFVHGDIKPENIMIDEKGKLRLIDLGLCSFYDKNEKLYDMTGTPGYMSPENNSDDDEGHNGSLSDVFSVGSLLYMMLEGVELYIKNREEHMIILGRVDYVHFADISSEAKEFIASLLAKEPERIDIEAIKKSAFFTKDYDMASYNNYTKERVFFGTPDKSIVQAIAETCGFLLPNIEDDIEKYIANCNPARESMFSGNYDSKPSVLLYFLVDDKLKELGIKTSPPEEVKEKEALIITSENYEVLLKNFMNFLGSQEGNMKANHFFSTTAVEFDLHGETEENFSPNE